jgi:transposase-like protein
MSQSSPEIQCPKCRSREYVKNGFFNNKQRYKCKSCNCNYTTFKPRGYPKELREECIEWFLEGSSLRSISRRLKVNIATVINWIRQEAESIPALEKKYRDTNRKG